MNFHDTSQSPSPADEPHALREIVSSRVLDFPATLVFRAFVDPRHLAQWWGPAGFTNTFEEFDPRPGGVWRFVMRGPDGARHRNESIFEELVEPERIVFRHVSAPRFRMTITLAGQAARTAVTWQMLFPTAAECARIKQFAIEANEQNFDRLEACLATMGTAAGD
jgi:uncharacterized protein YndB with AHSA1/START domain